MPCIYLYMYSEGKCCQLTFSEKLCPLLDLEYDRACLDEEVLLQVEPHLHGEVKQRSLPVSVTPHTLRVLVTYKGRLQVKFLGLNPWSPLNLNLVHQHGESLLPWLELKTNQSLGFIRFRIFFNFGLIETQSNLLILTVEVKLFEEVADDVRSETWLVDYSPDAECIIVTRLNLA